LAADELIFVFRIRHFIYKGPKELLVEAGTVHNRNLLHGDVFESKAIAPQKAERFWEGAISEMHRLYVAHNLH